MCPIFGFLRRRKVESSGFPIGNPIPVASVSAPIGRAAPPKAKARKRGEYVKLSCKSYYNLHLRVSEDGRLTLERVGKYYYLCMRHGKNRTPLLYVRKKLVEQFANLCSQWNWLGVKELAYDLLSKKYGQLQLEDEPYKPTGWSLGFGLWLFVSGKGGGVLIAKRFKPKGKFYYYLAIRQRGTRRKYTHRYLAPVPWEHLRYAFIRPQSRKEYKPIVDYLQTTGWDILNYSMIIKPKLIPNWLIRKRVEEARRASREDEGVIGEAMEEAEDWGWEEVLEEYEENGDIEAAEEVREWLGEEYDEEY
jgi:hypothetical protein